MNPRKRTIHVGATHLGGAKPITLDDMASVDTTVKKAFTVLGVATAVLGAYFAFRTYKAAKAVKESITEIQRKNAEASLHTPPGAGS